MSSELNKYEATQPFILLVPRRTKPWGKGGKMKSQRVLILGAAGRDFHNFNVVFRDNHANKVVGFTATQIAGIAGRRYHARLAGKI